MAKTMSASKLITNGQIENLVDKLRAAIRKHRSEITAQAAQQILGVENLGMEFYEVVRTRVEKIANMIIRHVKIDRTRSPRQALEATGRRLYVNDAVVATMLHGTSDETDVYFFKPGRYLSDDELEKDYDAHGLKPASPYLLARINEDDSVFADEHPNGTHWKDADGKWCFASFGRWDDERSVNVVRHDSDWRGFWWFAGVRK